MVKILQQRNTAKTVMLRTLTTIDVKKKKTPENPQQPQNKKQPKCHITYLCNVLSLIDDVCDFALLCVFNFNMSVRVFYKNPSFFPKYDSLLQILSLIMLQLTSLIQSEIVHETVEASHLPLLSIICLILRAKQKCFIES